MDLSRKPLLRLGSVKSRETFFVRSQFEIEVVPLHEKRQAMNSEPRQRTISIPGVLDKRFREYCVRHRLGRTEAIASLLDMADSRDTTHDLLQEILAKLDTLQVQEPCAPAYTPQPIFSCGGMVLDLDGRRWFAKGKCMGKSVLEVIEEDPGYVSWLLADAEKYDPEVRFFLTKEEQETFRRHKN